MAVSLKPLLAAGFDLKLLRKWNTRDGGGYQFMLTHKGAVVCEVTDEGRGGETRFQWLCLYDLPHGIPTTLAERNKHAKQGSLSKVAKEILDTIAAATPEVESFDMMLKPDAGWLMEGLVDLADLRKVARRRQPFARRGMMRSHTTPSMLCVMTGCGRTLPRSILVL